MADEQTVSIDIPGVGAVDFPSSMSSADMNAAAKRLYDQANPPAKPSTNIGLALTAASQVIPAAANIATRIATSPTLPQTTATIGRIIGGISPIVGGAVTGGTASGPLAAMGGAGLGVAGAAKGSYMGGRTGYFTGKLLQRAAPPIANVLEKAVPAAQMFGRMVSPQNMLDLAQVAEPNRRDIGFLGMGHSVDVPGAEPPVLNALAAKLRDAILRRLGAQQP